MGIISWFINPQTSLGGPILYVVKTATYGVDYYGSTNIIWICVFIYIYLLMDVTPKSSILIGFLWLSIINNPWLVVWNMNFIFHFMYGMSSSPSKNSYFSIWLLHHQPDMDMCVCLYVCMYVCIYIYIYVWLMYIYQYIHTYYNIYMC